MRSPSKPILLLVVWVALWGAFARGQDRIALLPPIDFNLEQDAFANEPLSDADPAIIAPK